MTLGLASLLPSIPSAVAQESCTYDAGAHSVLASVSSPGWSDPGANKISIAGGQITYEGSPCGGATVFNTDSASISGSAIEEVIKIDLRGGSFGPGLTPEPDGLPEIEIYVDLGAGRDDFVAVRGTQGSDSIVLGQDGYGLNPDEDADILPANAGGWIVWGDRGDDTINGHGGSGTGDRATAFLALYGMTGNDRILGGRRLNLLAGSAGRDVLIGGRGRDAMEGGSGDDKLKGKAGDDRLEGGPGKDTCVPGPGSWFIDSCERPCTPGYVQCLPPASDYDCSGGPGNGPAYVDGPVKVTGSDPYGLDADGDGIGCE
jgi:hypothetical protein